MRVKCVSVRLESLVSISEKAYKATAFDGSTAIIPKSQVYGRDWDVLKSEAWWISCWILEQKPELQFSWKKTATFDKDSGNRLPETEVEKWKPVKEQVKSEELRAHQRIKAYVVSVTESGKFGPQIILSRKSPNFV